MTIDEELQLLKAEESKLIELQKARLNVKKLKEHLFDGKPLLSPSSIKWQKKERIAAFASNYLAQYGSATTHDIVCAIQAIEPEILQSRQNKRVAVSQAMGYKKYLFKPDRRIGWTLIEANE